MKLFYSIVILSVLVSCGRGFETYEKPTRLRVKELKAGVCYVLVSRTEKSKKSPSGVQDKTDYFRLLQSTDTIPAELGTRFGVEYVVLANQKTYVDIEYVWKFPMAMVNANGKEFSEVRRKSGRYTHYRTFNTYYLQHDYELVKGDWVFQMFYKRDLIFEKHFFLK